MRKVIVPPLSGVFSAWGMCMTAPRADVVRTQILGSAGYDRCGDRRALRGAREPDRGRDAGARRDGAHRRGDLHPRRGRALPRPGAHRARARARRADLGGDASRRISTSCICARTRSTCGAIPPSSSSPSTSRRTAGRPARRRCPRGFPPSPGVAAGARAPARRRLRRRRRTHETAMCPGARELPARLLRARPARDRGADDHDARPPPAGARGRRLRQPRDLATLRRASRRRRGLGRGPGPAHPPSAAAPASRPATGSHEPALRPLGRRISATSRARAMTTSAVP